MKKPETSNSKAALRVLWLGFGVIIIPVFFGLFVTFFPEFFLSAYLELFSVFATADSYGDGPSIAVGLGATIIYMIATFFIFRTCVDLYLKGERSCALWVSIFSAILITLLLVSMFIEDSPIGIYGVSLI